MTFRPDLWGIETEAQQFVSLVTRTLPVTAATVALWDEPSLTLTVKAVDSLRRVDGSPPVGIRVPLSEAAWYRTAFERSEPVLLEGGDGRRFGFEREAEFALVPPVRSVYLVPIRFTDETVGVLVLGEARAAERGGFSSDKQQRCQTMLEEFVATTAPAWEARRLRRQVRAMSSLLQLVRGVSQARSFDDVLSSLAAEVADWLGTPVRAALLGMTGREVQLLARVHLPEEIVSDGGRQMLLAMTRSGSQRPGPVSITVVGEDPLDPLAAVVPATENWTRIGVPLMRDERPIGVACLYVEDELRLADWELEALRRRGEIAALGVEAVKTALTVEAEQERLHQVAFELLTGYRWALLQEVFSNLGRTLTTSVERRLRETLAQLVDQTRVTPDAAATERPDLVTAVVAQIDAAFADLWESNGALEATATSLDVNDLVGRAVRIARMSLDDLPRRRGVTVDVRFEPATHPVLVEGSLVIIGALVHAIEGAIAAMPRGGEVLIRTARENGHAVISVEDTGAEPAGDAGVNEFARFSVKHPDVVLSLVQSIVHPYGGRATLEPRKASGSALVVHLPTSSSMKTGA